MNKRIKRAAAALAALWCAAVLSGCTLMSFKSPGVAEEQPPTAEDIPEAPDVFAILDEDKLSIEDRLTDEGGRELAIYRASFPYFSGGENKAIDNINAYYEEEFSQIGEDKERFFALVREKPSEDVRSSVFSYKLIDAPAGYIAVLRSFEGVDTLGSERRSHYCEVFSSSTGWRLKFTDVFGEKSEEALAALREAVGEWCAERECSAAWLDSMSDETLTDEFAFDSETFYLAVPSGSAPEGDTLIELPVGKLSDYFTQ